MEALGLAGIEARCNSIRAEFGIVQDLVGIDVADTGDHMLIEQQRFQRSLRRPDCRTQVHRLEWVGDRINPEPREFGKLDVDVAWIKYDDFTECAWVHEPGLVSIVQVHDDMRVGRTFGSLGREQHLPTHSEMDHHRITGVEREQQVFAASIDPLDDGVGEASDQRTSGSPTNHTFTPYLDINDPSTSEMAVQSSPNGLDLGEFRHRLLVLLSDYGNAHHEIERQACVAAPCSADFFDRPSPSPSTSPSTNASARKDFA
jgi:hypothetical protein